MKNDSITRVMTPAPATISPNATTVEAERLMRGNKCHHIPVTEADRLVGMLSARDLLKALVLRGENGTEAPLLVGAVMQRRVNALPQTATLLDAARALTAGDIHAMPVVAPNNVVTGIVTSSDLIETLIDALVHPVAGDWAAHLSSDGDPKPNEITVLRAVYRAVLNYLESGRGELEHSRLLRAVDLTRETLRETTVGI